MPACLMDEYRVRSDLDMWAIPRFAQEVLRFDPSKLQTDLESNYPVVGKDEEIAPSKAQWVDGTNEALNYRGHDLKRSKMWYQRRAPEEIGYIKYFYTGWQHRIIGATSEINGCPELAPIADKYDEWAKDVGYPLANHYIVTKYVDGAHHIGWHYDMISPNRSSQAR